MVKYQFHSLSFPHGSLNASTMLKLTKLLKKQTLILTLIVCILCLFILSFSPDSLAISNCCNGDSESDVCGRSNCVARCTAEDPLNIYHRFNGKRGEVNDFIHSIYALPGKVMSIIQ